MMRSNLFWGAVLVIIGALLLLNSLGIFTVNVWGLIWPIFLIVLGLWSLWGVFAGPRLAGTEEVTIPLEDASRARLRIRHGAGRLRIDAGADIGKLVDGTFGGGLDYHPRREGDALTVDMRVPTGGFPHMISPWTWMRGRGLDWSFGLNREVPLSLEFETGASDMRLDLTDLRVTDLRLQTGASETKLLLPANAGHTRVNINAGAASVSARVPAGVAAQIRARGGLSEIKVDKNRFPRTGGVYQSPDYDTAANKVDIVIEMGVGSVNVR
jgi:hypothetical protein